MGGLFTKGVTLYVVNINEDSTTQITIVKNVTTPRDIAIEMEKKYFLSEDNLSLLKIEEEKGYYIAWNGILLSPDQNLIDAGVRGGDYIFYSRFNLSEKKDPQTFLDLQRNFKPPQRIIHKSVYVPPMGGGYQYNSEGRNVETHHQQNFIL